MPPENERQAPVRNNRVKPISPVLAGFALLVVLLVLVTLFVLFSAPRLEMPGSHVPQLRPPRTRTEMRAARQAYQLWREGEKPR